MLCLYSFACIKFMRLRPWGCLVKNLAVNLKNGTNLAGDEELHAGYGNVIFKFDTTHFGKNRSASALVPVIPLP